MEYGLDRSARRRFQAINQHVPVCSNFAMRLAARTFTCCWKAWLGGYAIGFDSGALRVQASAMLHGSKSAEGSGCSKRDWRGCDCGGYYDYEDLAQGAGGFLPGRDFLGTDACLLCQAVCLCPRQIRSGIDSCRGQLFQGLWAYSRHGLQAVAF